MYSSIVSTLSQPETTYLLQSFLGTLVLLCLIERLLPRQQQGYGSRSIRNLVLLMVNTLLKLLLPVSLVAASLFALFEQFGVLNMVKLGLWTKIFIAWLVLDLFSYWLHRCYHRFAFLWRFHRVHHTDRAVDVTTPFRTHPVEMLITLCGKGAVIVLFGMPLLGVIIYEVIVAAMAVWAHANVRLHAKLDSTLSLVFVTPGFHLRHHGDTAEGCKQNYGLVLTVWDRLFVTVSDRALDEQPSSVSISAASEGESFTGLLLSPFRGVGREQIK